MSEILNRTATKAGLFYTIANIFLKGCAFLTLPIFTRILSTGDFGKYNTYIAYEGIITAILGLGFYGTVKNAKIDFKEKFNDYLSSILCLTFILFLAVLLIVNLYLAFFDTFLGFDKFVSNCLILQSYGSFLVFFYGSKLNIEFKYKSYIVISFFNTIGNIIMSLFLIIYIFPNQRYLGRIFGSALPVVLVGVLIFIHIIKTGKCFYNNNYWKYALAIGLPLVPHAISQSVLSQFDRIMIDSLCGSSEAGIYSFIYTVCTVLYVVSVSVDNAWTPWVFIQLDSKNRNEIKEASSEYLLLFNCLTVGFICVTPEITKLIADEAYWSGIDLIIPIAMANYFIFLYMLPVNVEYFYKKTKYIPIGTVTSALLNIVLNLVFINNFGYKAAAYTTLVSYVALFIFHYIIAHKFSIDKIYDNRYLWKSILSVSLIALVVFFCNKNTIVGIIVRYSIVICILLILYKYKDKIIFILRKK